MNLFVAIRVLGERAITSASGSGFPGRFLFFLPAGLVVVVVVELDLELELLLVGLVSAGSGEKALTDGGTANMFADMTSIRKMNI